MSTVQVVGEVIVARISPAPLWSENRSSVCPAVAAKVENRLAEAVAGEIGFRAVGVEDPQRSDEPGSLGSDTSRRRRPYTEVGVAEPPDPRG